MRLLLVTHYMPPHEGGIERIAEDHAHTAHAAGHAVTWVASRVPGNTRVRETTSWGTAVRVPCWNGPEDLAGVPYPIWLPPAGRTLRALVAASDLVHAHDVLYPGTSIALAEAQRRGVPRLITQHVGFVPYAGRVRPAVQRLAYRTIGRRNAARASLVGWYNAGARDWLNAAAGCDRPDRYLPNAVDAELFRPAHNSDEKSEIRRRLGLPPDRPLVVFVGRLVHKKGAQIVIDAALPEHHLLLIGERGEVSLRDKSNIELRPFVPRPALAEILRAADILALPSTGEGFPLVAQEAMASGLAVILGDDPSYPAQVDPGSVVFVAPTVASLSAILTRLVRSPTERTDLGRRARASALTHWGVAACRARLLAVYAELTHGTAPPR